MASRATRAISTAAILTLGSLGGVPVAVAQEGPGAAPGEVTAAEKQAFDLAKPVFEKHCHKCHATRTGHGNENALAHLNMNGYPFTGPHAAEAGTAIREVLGATGKEPTMPDDDPGAVKGEELERVLAWAAEFEKARARGAPVAAEEHSHDKAHAPKARGATGEHEHDRAHAKAAPGAAEEHEHEREPVAVTPAQLPPIIARATMIPGHPGKAGGFHVMLNAYAHLQNVGLDRYTITNAGESHSAGRTLPLLTDDWAMAYWREGHGWVEALLMLDFEPLTVGKGGYPELGQSGEGLVDAQHSHQLIHQAIVAVHPLSGFVDPDYDLSLFAGQGSATIGPPIFMHRPSSGGPTVPRKHHKGENPHETFPVLGASFRWKNLALEASAFSARELLPDDSRFYPHAAAPKSFAARIRYDLWGGELQISGERLREQGSGEPDAWQGSASLSSLWYLRGWWINSLLDFAIDDPDDEPSSRALLYEVIVRDPTFRSSFWGRSENNQREESMAFGGGVTEWSFRSIGAEHVFAVSPRAGLQLGFFGEATYIDIPDELEAIYGRENAVTLNVGLHLFGMWMLHR